MICAIVPRAHVHAAGPGPTPTSRRVTISRHGRFGIASGLGRTGRHGSCALAASDAAHHHHETRRGNRGRGDAGARGGDRRRRSMEHMKIPGTDLSPSRIGLGTWAMGGWMWGGTDEERSIRTICAALERGITLIDTAPAYGQGRSEEIVGKAVARWGPRGRVLLAPHGRRW